MFSYPKTSKLKMSLWSFLANHPKMDSIAQITNMHPINDANLKTGKGLIVISEVSDSKKGRYLTNEISAPRLQFATYAKTEAQCLDVAERLEDILQNRSHLDLEMSGQVLHLAAYEPGLSIPTRFSEELALFVCATVYRFELSRVQD